MYCTYGTLHIQYLPIHNYIPIKGIKSCSYANYNPCHTKTKSVFSVLKMCINDVVKKKRERKEKKERKTSEINFNISYYEHKEKKG